MNADMETQNFTTSIWYFVTIGTSGEQINLDDAGLRKWVITFWEQQMRKDGWAEHELMLSRTALHALVCIDRGDEAGEEALKHSLEAFCQESDPGGLLWRGENKIRTLRSAVEIMGIRDFFAHKLMMREQG